MQKMDIFMVQTQKCLKPALFLVASRGKLL